MISMKVSTETPVSGRDVSGLVPPLVELASLGRDALVVAQRATAAARYLDAFVSASFAMVRSGRWHPWVVDRRLRLALLAVGSLRNRAARAADLANSSVSLSDASLDVSMDELVATACSFARTSRRRVEAIKERWETLEKHLTPFIEQYGVEDGVPWVSVDAGDLLDAIDQHLENLDDSTRLGYISLHVQEELLNRALDDIKDKTDPNEAIETIRRAYRAIDMTGYTPAHNFAYAHKRTTQELTWIAEFWNRLPNWAPEEAEELTTALKHITRYQSHRAQDIREDIERGTRRLYRHSNQPTT